MRIDFCTSLAIDGVPKLAALIKSIEKNVRSPYVFWVLCEGENVRAALEGFEFDRMNYIQLQDFERSDQELMAVKKQRDPFEYNCTLRPSWILWLLDNDPNIEYLTYMDTDLYFFGSPEPLYKELDDASVLLTSHRLSKLARATGVDVDVVGKFNAGWVAVKNDDEARQILRWWRSQCLEWCFRHPVPGKFGEQKYLDEFEKLSNRVRVLEHLGANLAPWNMNDYRISESRTGEIIVENSPLIFFHFHALKIPGESSFKVDKELGRQTFQFTNPNYVITSELMRLVYAPYVKVLKGFVLNEYPLRYSRFDFRGWRSIKRYKRLLISLRSKLLLAGIYLFK